MSITTEEVREAIADPSLDTADRIWVLFEIMKRTNGGRRQLVAAVVIIVGSSVLAFNMWGWNGVQIFVWTLIIATAVFFLLILPRPK